MAHVKEIDLIALAGGELPADRAAEVRAHLDACPSCKALYDETCRVWKQLDAWTPPVPTLDLSPGVMKRARVRAFSWRRFALKTAATVLIAAGVGHGSARLLFPATSRSAAKPSVEEVARDLYVDTLADPGPAGLTEPMITDDNAPGGSLR